MIVLGIDPGTRHLGWGVVKALGAKVEHIAHGVIHTDTEQSLAYRLLEIDDALREMLATHSPSTAGVESLFFSKDPQAAAKLGHARGVVLLALHRAGLTIGEYAPAHVKRAIVGRGAADKHQVAMVISAILRLSKPPPADAADALAIAITHARVCGLPQLAPPQLRIRAHRLADQLASREYPRALALSMGVSTMAPSDNPLPARKLGLAPAFPSKN